MNIYSSYAGRDLNFDVMEKLDPQSGKTMVLIKHDSLRDVVYNQLNITEKGSVSYNYVKSERDHAVVECTIKDGTGRVVTEIGEAVPETLDNNIALSYPVLTAHQRAFDRAAILLLKLAGKQLSNDEMGEFLTIDFEAGFLKEDLQAEPEYPVDDNDGAEFMNAPITTTQSEMIEDEPEGVEDVIDPSDRLKELGQKIPLIGGNKNEGLTLDEMYEKRKDYLQKLVSLKTPNDKLKDIVNDIKEYLELKGEAV